MTEEQGTFDLWGSSGSDDNFTLDSLVEENKELMRTYRNRFQAVFNVPLVKYMNIITGFELMKFDEDIIRSPGDKSCAAELERLYGEEGLSVICGLLKMNMEALKNDIRREKANQND